MQKPKTTVRGKFCADWWLLKPGINKVELPMHDIIVEEGFLLNKRLPRKTLIVRDMSVDFKTQERKPYRGKRHLIPKVPLSLSEDIRFLGTQRYHFVFPVQILVENFGSFFFTIENTHPSKTFKIGYAVKGVGVENEKTAVR